MMYFAFPCCLSNSFSMNSLTRDELFQTAELALAGGFPDIGLKYALMAIDIDPILDEKEQSIFFATYRLLGNRLYHSILGLKMIYDCEAGSEINAKAVASLIHDVTNELVKLCSDLSSVISERLLPKVDGPDRAVYYLIMGDFARFVAELDVDESEEAVEASLANYNDARKWARSIPIEEPVHLDIILNIARLMKDVLGREDEAVALAESTYDTAWSRLSNLDEGKASTSREILRVLKDNAIAWIT